MKTKIIPGMRFGRLTVIERSGTDSDGKALWRCICDCHNILRVPGGNLVSGDTTSCGCYQKELAGVTDKRIYPTHGMTETRLYTIWTDMKQRCNNPRDPFFSDYGGRGIKVCEEWETDFSMFYTWAISHGYSIMLTIDRVNNDRGYSPDNCRWVTFEKQANDKRRRDDNAADVKAN